MQKLTKAFRELETLGYFARRRLADCRTCAMTEIPEEFDNLYVYTTDQSDSDKENQYLYWSAPDDDPREIIKVLRKHGLKVKKPKTPNIAIIIINN